MLTLRPIIVLLSAAALLLAGCNTNSASSTPTGNQQSHANGHSPSELRAAYTAYWNAFTKPDPSKYCSMLTDKESGQFVEEVSSSGLAGHPKSCGAAVMTTYTMMKAFSALPKLTITGVSLDGDTGIVKWSTRSSNSSDAGIARLVYRDGAWLVDEESSTGPNKAKANIARWLSNWCRLRLGMTKARAITRMGDPTSAYDATEAIPQLNWEQGAYSFTAFMNTGNVVTQLQANYANLGAADRAKVPCPAVRR
jgi:hypothetical protein